ncbi:cell wall anchor protein [[Clostridium] spiroforme]|nr:cell wall anchor protein [Thomasclavelia spiroformis]MBM6880016.1 cell wall anchor protein [Thomasclavelia spiroformis]
MKKLLSSLLVACLMFVASISATSAVGTITAKEQQIIDALQAGVEVDGVKVTLQAADINAAKTYLTNNDITDDQVSTVLSQISAAKSYMQTNKIKDIASIKGAHATAILKYAQAAASALNLTLTVGADGTVTVKDASGKLVYSTAQVIKKTGYDLTQTVAMAGGLVAVLLAAGLIAKRKELLA